MEEAKAMIISITITAVSIVLCGVLIFGVLL